MFILVDGKQWKVFEGFNMMRRMGTPFLLITESRVEGGAYYLGDKEYEKKYYIWNKRLSKTTWIYK